MQPEDMNKLNRLEEMKTKLFSKNFQAPVEHRDNFSHLNKKEVIDSWGDKEKPAPEAGEKFFMKTSLFKKFFIFSLAFFGLSLLYAAYVFFAGGNTVSNNNIDISVIGNNFTGGGDDLPLIVGVTNKNNSDLELADLVVEYPKGSSGDLSSNTTTFRESLGNISAGAVRNENLKIVLFGEQGSVRPVKISLEYRVAGSNAIFVKDTMYQVNINSTPINISVDSPSTISPNQDITLNVKVILNATKAVPNALLKLDYPAGFQFTKAVPAPSFGNNIWTLGDLAPGAEHDIAVTGKMVDVFDGEQKTFNISSGSQSSSDKSVIDIVFNAIKDTITIKKAFIEAVISVNGVSQREYATDWKTPISAEIHYVNNLDTVINDLSITAKFSGNAYDRKTINVQQGFYDSGTDTIIWDKSLVNNLAQISPGEAGSVFFSVAPLALYGTGGILVDPTINIEVDIAGKQAVQGFAVNQLTNSSSSIIRIISDVGFSAKAFHYSGPFTNTGPIPPKVGEPSTYTITWSLSNTANSISKTQINSTLPPWMSFVGPISPSSEDLTFNPSTKEIIWNADRIDRGAGITGPARTVSFQVSFTPSLSQVGSVPILVNDAILTAHDDFANVDVRVNKSGVNTKLDSDAAFPDNGSVVVN